MNKVNTVKTVNIVKTVKTIKNAERSPRRQSIRLRQKQKDFKEIFFPPFFLIEGIKP